MLEFIKPKNVYYLSIIVNKKHFLLTIVIFWFSINNSKAQEIQNIINQQDLIIRNQQNFSDFDSRQKEQEQVKEEFEKKSSQEIISTQDEIADITKPKDCKIIKNVIISDSQILSKDKINSLSSKLVGSCFNNKKISQIIENISDLYDSVGMITTEIEINQSQIDQGIIEFKIIEKNLEEIIINNSKNNSSLSYKLNKFTAFGNIEGKKLNINDINQGLFQINRLASNSAKYRIENGSSRHHNKIFIDNNSRFPATLNASHDNLGNKSTGVYRTIFRSSFDNLLRLNDNLQLTYNTNLNDQSSLKDITTYSANLYLPLNYYSLTIESSMSDFYGKDSQNRNFSGFSKRSAVILNKLFIENNDFRLSAKIGLTQKETASYLQQTKIVNSQRKLTIVNLAVLNTYFVNRDLVFFFKPSIIRGIDTLGANRDYSFKNPQLDFTIFKLYFNFQKNLDLFSLSRPIVITSEIDSQIANKILFGSEQFSIGGYSTVRGFQERNIAGEKGLFFRNKVAINFSSITNKLNIKPNKYFNKIVLEPFIDAGHIYQKTTSKSSSIAGSGFATTYLNKYFNASLTMSWALRQSNLSVSKYKENKLIYFELKTNCCNF